MGKADEEQPLPATVVFPDPQRNAEGNCCGCGSIRKFIGLRCIFVLLLSAAVFLPAVFWLPPFLQWADQKDLHSNSRYKGGFSIFLYFFLNYNLLFNFKFLSKAIG